MAEEQRCLWDPKNDGYPKHKLRVKVFEEFAIKIKIQYLLMSCLTGGKTSFTLLCPNKLVPSFSRHLFPQINELL
ncbi:hypothetical protein E2C01_055919 [Portunus trituberculatus]|uniref:MADF domain-containing protein n=1 Tax=Portunus trituberculatus TaxID=210409 RepID=A0A5B7GSQ5_PORTR|nr:hypothetical protein [Portunus trituberculatus]